jgi:cytochrome c oxidase cbb3-type subunit 3/ubiquinol-cytochrome c reductase cytochrome c subunit
MQRLHILLVFLCVLVVGACHKKTAVDPVAASGSQLYARMCAVCHGDAGEGYRADQAPRLAQPDLLASASDDFLREVIASGRAGSTMSAWGKARGGPLSAEQVDAVIRFMRTWQQGRVVKLDESPLRGDAARGAPLFQARCAMCHGPRGGGASGPRVGNADFLRSASDGFLRYAITHGRPNTKMPPYEATLAPAEIDSVVATLRGFLATLPPPVAAPSPTTPLPLGPVPLHPKGPEPKGFTPTPGTTNVDVVKAELDRGAKMAILDARAPPDYITEHITGAVSVPFYDPTPYLDKLPRDAWLVCYCACPHAESGQLAQKLLAAGFKKVTVLNEGLLVWRSKQYPISKGERAGP